jgi:hypothetical protein
VMASAAICLRISIGMPSNQNDPVFRKPVAVRLSARVGYGEYGFPSAWGDEDRICLP